LKFGMSLWTPALALLLAAALAAAQEVMLEFEPSIIRLGETTRLTLTAKNLKNAPQPTQSQLDGLHTGPFGSTSHQTRIINGKKESSVAYSAPVMPQQAGEFTLPFTYQADGRTWQLTARLKVLEPQEGDGGTTLDELFFAELQTDRDRIYVQEEFNLVLSVYAIREARLAQNAVQLDGMPQSGFAETRWDRWESLGATQIERNGRIYTVQRFRASTRALTAGVFELHPQVGLNVLVDEPASRRRDPFFGGSLFDDFFNQARARTVPAALQPLRLEARSLPQENRPAGFNNAVGRFQFIVDGIPPEVHAGDPITIRMTVRGKGNLNQITPPRIEEISGLRVYDPSPLPGGEGEQVFEQVLIPRNPQLTEIPAITFSWFDTETETYRTIQHGPFPITVKPGTAGSAARITGPEAAGSDPLPVLGEDILYLKPAPARKSRQLRLHLWLIGLMGLNALAWPLEQFRRRREAPTLRRRREAAATARRALRHARHALHRHDAPACYSALWDGLRAIFTAHLNLPPGESEPAAIRQRLESFGWPEPELRALQSILEHCEAIRYGASHQATNAELHAALATVQKTLQRCERIKPS